MEKIINKTKECIVFERARMLEEYKNIALNFLNGKGSNSLGEHIDIIFNLRLFEKYINDIYNSDCKIVFNQYGYLSYFVKIQHFNKKQIFDLVMCLLKKNIDSGILEEEASLIELADLVGNTPASIAEFLDSDIKELAESELELMSKSEKAKFLEKTNEDLHLEKTVYRIIRDSYFSKKDIYQSEDIETLKNAFLQLGMSEIVVEDIVYVLRKDLEKRIKEQSIVSVPSKRKNLDKAQKKVLTKKQYRILLDKLQLYFDIDKNKPVRILTMDEIIDCTSLLFELGYNNEQVRSILKNIGYYQLKEQNPISWYMDNYEKLRYYNNPIYKENIDNVEEYFKELFIASDDEYVFWKENIAYEVGEIYAMLPKTYQYELTKATANEKRTR